MQALKIHNKVYPNFKGVPLGKSRRAKALVDLYCSASTLAAASDIVHTVGHANIALGSYRQAKDFEIPWEIIPLAATLVSYRIFLVNDIIH